jgi:cephalosporin hydroxylase
MNHDELFALEVRRNIKNLGNDEKLKKLTKDWFLQSLVNKYTYNFSSLGRPIIQYPQDMVAMQELIWKIKPDLIIETGIAHGGSLIMNASMLALIDYCEAVETGTVLDPVTTKRRVLGIDIDIREHNRKSIEAHPMSHRIDMIQGSSISINIIEQVHQYAKSFSKILISLDSNHTHSHVLEELRAYAPLTSKESYCVVFDTVVEDLPKGMYPNRSWDVGNNPKTAVFEYINELKNSAHMATDGDVLMFEIDKVLDNKLLISVAPDGYLKRV